jgi:hypothetical protein
MFFPLQRADWLARTCTVQCSILLWDYTYVSIWHHVFEGCSLACRPWLKNGVNVNTPRRPIRTYPSLFTPILFSDSYHHMISTAIRSVPFFSIIFPYYDPVIWHMFFSVVSSIEGPFLMNIAFRAFFCRIVGSILGCQCMF